MKKEDQEIIFVPKPSLKDSVCEAANKNGYTCTVRDSILYFSDIEKMEEIKEWLLKNYGSEEETRKGKVVRVPFSFGFRR